MKKVIDACDQLDKINQVESWLEEHGLKVHNTRYTGAKKLLSQGVHAGEIDEDQMVQFQWALLELDDYLQIHEFLGNVTHRRFLDTLGKSLKGPHQNKLEDKGAAAAGRNFMFELVLAAKLAQLGFDVGFDGDADVILKIDEITVHVECKNVLGENMDTLLKKAFKQIRQRCAQAVVTENQYGIGAICLTRYCAQESHRNGPMVAEREVIEAEMRGTVSKFDFSNLRDDFPQVIGVITHFALPFWTPDDMQLKMLRRFDFHPLLPSNHEAVRTIKKLWCS